MPLPVNVKATADDLGLYPSVNYAILQCYQNGYINSTSLITNTAYFEETINLIHNNDCISNIGVHINFAEGKPVSNFNLQNYLDKDGNWNLQKTNKKITVLDSIAKESFLKEIYAQINRALSANISIVHLDSHYHLHTLPCFYQLFIRAAKRYKLKLRLAQTYNEGNYIKFAYRKYVNREIKKSYTGYSDYFETVTGFLKNGEPFYRNNTVEIMLHPDIDKTGRLTDHVDKSTLEAWINYITA